MSNHRSGSAITPSAQQALSAVEDAGEKLRVARRDFVKVFGFGGLALLACGGSEPVAGAEPAQAAEALTPPQAGPYAAAWNFAPGLLYMNIGTTGASPRAVVDGFATSYRDVAADPKAYFFGQQAWRNAIAPGFGCDPYELVMSFNTTDGLWRIVQGLEWKKNDEVISTNMEESAGIAVNELLRDRFGVEVREVKIPTGDAYSDGELFRRFERELTPRTKAILFSSPIYLTGTRLQERDLCLWAARHGLVSIVDAAHQPGMLAMNLHEMGCDFMSGAGHKWQCGPGQTGFLYVRNGANPDPYVRTAPAGDLGFLGVPGPTVDVPVPGYANTTPPPRYWPTNTLLYGKENGVEVLRNGVRNPDHNVAALLQLVGNGSLPTQQALYECCRLWDGWGRKDVEEYVVSLAQYLRARLVEIWGPQSLAFPYDAAGNHVGRIALTSFNPFSPGSDYNADLTAAEAKAQKSAAGSALSALRSRHQVVLRTTTVPHSLRSDPSQSATAETSSTPIRISTHLFHSAADVDRCIAALLDVVPHP
jgi:selenocysteine lyase/cysteine desulfurase